jgi:formate dehydrogenase subunit gamma
VVHRWAGIVFIAGPVLYILLNFDRFARFIDTISSISKDDFGWLKVMGGYLPFIKVEEVPPQDKYNAGQKCWGG